MSSVAASFAFHLIFTQILFACVNPWQKVKCHVCVKPETVPWWCSPHPLVSSPPVSPRYWQKHTCVCLQPLGRRISPRSNQPLLSPLCPDNQLLRIRVVVCWNTKKYRTDWALLLLGSHEQRGISALCARYDNRPSLVWCWHYEAGKIT